MKKIYTGIAIAATMLAASTNTVSAQSDVKLVSTEYYGDAMTGGSAKTGMIKYFYNAEGHLIGSYETKGANDQTPFQRTTYNYNSKGYLVSETTWQWGLTSTGDGWYGEETMNHIIDKNGNIKALQSQYELPWGGTFTYNQYEYEYDAQGNKTKETYYLSMRGSAAEKQYTVTYSDFSAGKNKPAKAVKESIWPSECFEAEYTYNANGDCVEYIENMTDYEQAGSEYGKKEEWTYNGTFCTKHEVFKWIEATGEWYVSSRTTYDAVNGNEKVVRVKNYNASPYFDGDNVVDTELTKNIVETVNKYVDFEGMAEVATCELTAEKNGVGKVRLFATVPEIAQFGTVRYDVYRDMQFLKSATFEELVAAGQIDPVSNNVIIYDNDVKTGEHNYFIQIMKLANDNEFDETVEWIGYNVSNFATINLDLDLPVATNIRMASADKADGIDGSATIAYDFPSTVDPAFGFQGNYLFIKTLGTMRLTPDSETTKTGNGQLTATLISSETIDAYIQSRYNVGVANSEIVTLSMDVPTTITSIEAAKKGAMFFDLSGRQVSNKNLRGQYIMVEGNTVRKVTVK